MQGPRFALRGPSVPLQALHSPYRGFLNCLISVTAPGQVHGQLPECRSWQDKKNSENLRKNPYETAVYMVPYFNSSFTIDADMKAKRNNMISELITLRITKAKAKVKFGARYLCVPECEKSSVPININTKAKANTYFWGIHFTLISVSTVIRNQTNPGKYYITPPQPIFGPEGIFQGGGGGGVYFEAPPAAGISYAPPLLLRPPPLEGYFQRWEGGGV